MASRRRPPGKNRPSKSRLRKSGLRKDRPSKAAPGNRGSSKGETSNGGSSRERPGLEPAGGGLGNIRNSIDAVDARIHALLNERARFAQLVGISKSATGKEAHDLAMSISCVAPHSPRSAP